MTDAATPHIDAFTRYRQSRPEPGLKLFSPNLILAVLGIACVAVWIFAAPRVTGGRTHVLTTQSKDTMPDGVLTIVQLDVGQGDATFIHTPSGYNILIDCGEGANPENDHSRQYPATKYVVIPFLETHGIYELDLLILTHPDSDHGGGMSELIDWIYQKGGAVHLAVDCGVGKGARFYRDFLEALERNNI